MSKIERTTEETEVVITVERVAHEQKATYIRGSLSIGDDGENQCVVIMSCSKLDELEFAMCRLAQPGDIIHGLILHSDIAQKSFLCTAVFSVENPGKDEVPASALDRVKIETGLSEGDQQSSFQNATLQGAGDRLAFSVATEMDIPEDVSSQGEIAVADYLREQFSKATAVVPNLRFDIQLGVSHAVEAEFQ